MATAHDNVCLGTVKCVGETASAPGGGGAWWSYDAGGPRSTSGSWGGTTASKKRALGEDGKDKPHVGFSDLRRLFVFLLWKHTKYRVGKRKFTIVSVQKQFILLLIVINYCIIFHRNNCKPPFAPPCVIFLQGNNTVLFKTIFCFL